jgi:hypothetical protein
MQTETCWAECTRGTERRFPTISFQIQVPRFNKSWRKAMVLPEKAIMPASHLKFAFLVYRLIA